MSYELLVFFFITIIITGTKTSIAKPTGIMIASIQDYTPELGLAVIVEFFVIFVGGVGVTG
jgi:hypothetical protein